MNRETKWTAERCGREVYINAEIEDGSGHGIFTIALLEDGFGIDGSRAETDRHAALIAAAPLMVEALEAASEEIHGEFCTSKGHRPSCVKVAAALAAARGESQ